MVCRKHMKDSEELGTCNYAEMGMEGPTCATT